MKGAMSWPFKIIYFNIDVLVRMPYSMFSYL